MSLIGKLEDLGLAEILQIVSLSHKSGVLELNSRGRAGAIFFRSGLVIRATSSTFGVHLGDLLRRGGLIDAATLERALHLQQTTATGRRLGDILAAQFGIARAAIDALVSAHIERIVMSFFTWDEGVFAFELGEPEAIAATSLDPLQFMLESGLNPQWLAQEGSRLAEQQRAAAAEAAAGPAPARAPHPPPAGPHPVTVAAADQQTFNIGVELFRELGEASGLAPQQLPESPGLHLLRGMLEELHNPELGSDIILLILRFASELMNRAVIFLVKDDAIVGLGQFGIELSGESADVRVRQTRVPAGVDSLFQPVLSSKVPTRAAMDGSRSWDDYLRRQLGGEWPKEIFLGPLVSGGRVVAILYGDNLPAQTPVGDTETLEIFLSQAGLAMEQALLERRQAVGAVH